MLKKQKTFEERAGAWGQAWWTGFRSWTGSGLSSGTRPLFAACQVRRGFPSWRGKYRKTSHDRPRFSTTRNGPGVRRMAAAGPGGAAVWSSRHDRLLHAQPRWRIGGRACARGRLEPGHRACEIRHKLTVRGRGGFDRM